MTASEPEWEFEPIGSRRFRILSLDGGGIKGTFTAAFLAKLEELTGKRVVDHFDLIAGTSTGGIIGISLGLGLTTQEILDFYVDRGPTIFPATGFRRRRARHLLRVKYAARCLERALKEVLGERKLGESRTRLVIPAYDAVRGDVKLFKTAHHPRFKMDFAMPAWEVARATSAAPTYFPIFNRPEGHRWIDGGVWANNPAAVAVNEAVGPLRAEPAYVEVLSVGTTTEPFHVPVRLASKGWLHWGSTAIKLLFSAQEQGAAGLAHAVTDHDARLVRINETTMPKRFSLDKAEAIGELRSLGERRAAHEEKRLCQRFFDDPAPEFVPYHTPSALPTGVAVVRDNPAPHSAPSQEAADG